MFVNFELELLSSVTLFLGCQYYEMIQSQVYLMFYVFHAFFFHTQILFPAAAQF